MRRDPKGSSLGLTVEPGGTEYSCGCGMEAAGGRLSACSHFCLSVLPTVPSPRKRVTWPREFLYGSRATNTPPLPAT